GNVVITPAKDDYEQDSIVILTAQAAEGYEFISWSGDIGSAEYDAQSLTLTMDNHKDITATFSAVVVPAKGDIVINEVRST
ncbi:InlB B-repeat-containing protein, partial [Klebsiella pneumoniae]|uniref:InlB B-repeat-containing protein n=2 Tax=Gammaproteobacteria TaxID=1236 RepID=UPI003B5A1414